RSKIENITGKKIAVILTDSCCRPRRIGVSAYALTVSGIDPLEDRIGKKDLFGKELLMTMESRADQLATATNMLMGNTNESIPAAIVRDHGLELSDFEGWVDGIEPEEDLFAGIL
ncbi:coenzyme F420-0:L-glutamate ligase, partial [Patescibacteria group bacterium]|nr:coenzyme F420-0:L-glutamate ligase [Patescibacteria group bacterium]